MAPVHSAGPPSHLSAMGMDFIDFLGKGHRLAMMFKKLRQIISVRGLTCQLVACLQHQFHRLAPCHSILDPHGFGLRR